MTLRRAPRRRTARSAKRGRRPGHIEFDEKEDKDLHIDKEIDARGLNCPLPLMKAKKALTEMHSGQVLRVVATDSGSMRDFLAFAKQSGHEMIEQTNVGREYIHVLRCR